MLANARTKLISRRPRARTHLVHDPPASAAPGRLHRRTARVRMVPATLVPWHRGGDVLASNAARTFSAGGRLDYPRFHACMLLNAWSAAKVGLERVQNASFRTDPRLGAMGVSFNNSTRIPGNGRRVRPRELSRAAISRFGRSMFRPRGSLPLWSGRRRVTSGLRTTRLLYTSSRGEPDPELDSGGGGRYRTSALRAPPRDRTKAANRTRPAQNEKPTAPAQ